VVTRRLVCAIALSTLGCVGPNPRWDGPDDAGDGVGGDDDDDDGDDGAGSGTTSSTDGSDELGTEGSWGGDEASSGGVPSTDDGAPSPMCNDDQTLCDGACKNSERDKHACGPECLDCVELLGEDAECRESECREDSSGRG
jgi:hypothetical protein